MKKRKIIILTSIISLLSLTCIVFAAFLFNRIISGYANTGNVYEINNRILNYAFYSNKSKAEMQELASTDEGKETILSNLSTRLATAKRINENSIVCYATKRTGYADEVNEYHLPYLNQLGFSFSFKTSIDVYVRIHFEDAWISKKTYKSGRTEQNYIVKDQLNGKYEKMAKTDVNESNFAAYYTIKAFTPLTFSTSKSYYVKDTIEGIETYNYVSINEDQFNAQAALADDNPSKIKYYEITASKLEKYDASRDYYKFSAESPFAISADGWYYDAGSNIAYKKTKINVDETKNEPQSYSYSFNLDKNYYYQEHEGSYHESVKIELSYFVDVVQANRVYELWHVDPEALV